MKNFLVILLTLIFAMVSCSMPKGNKGFNEDFKGSVGGILGIGQPNAGGYTLRTNYLAYLEKGAGFMKGMESALSSGHTPQEVQDALATGQGLLGWNMFVVVKGKTFYVVWDDIDFLYNIYDPFIQQHKDGPELNIDLMPNEAGVQSFMFFYNEFYRLLAVLDNKGAIPQSRK